jgi:hypothetical protein
MAENRHQQKHTYVQVSGTQKIRSVFAEVVDELVNRSILERVFWLHVLRSFLENANALVIGSFDYANIVRSHRCNQSQIQHFLRRWHRTTTRRRRQWPLFCLFTKDAHHVQFRKEVSIEMEIASPLTIRTI